MSLEDMRKYVLEKDADLIQRFRENFAENSKNKVFENGLLSLVRQSSHLYGKPFVCVAASPHLDDNIHVLKEYQDRVVIVCVDVATKRLIDEGIKPDFVVGLETKNAGSRIFNQIDTKDLKLICPTVTHPETLKAFKGKKYFFNTQYNPNLPTGEIMNELTKDLQMFGNLPSKHYVGFVALQIAYNLRASKILLVGYGFSFKDDKTYSGNIENTICPEGDYKEQAKFDSEYIEIDGQKTLRNLLLYREATDALLEEAKMTNVYNCTEGGILYYNNMPLLSAINKFAPGKISKKGRRKKRRGK
jgi:hypothetical protein